MAVRSYDRSMQPGMGFGARAARAFAYVLLVVTCTVIAALGGYQVGLRTNPSEATVAAERSVATKEAVRRAVARQKAADRVLRRKALADAMAWQRERFESEMSARVAEVRLAEGKNAARAYRRGKAAGAATAVAEAEKAAADEADETDDGAR